MNRFANQRLILPAIFFALIIITIMVGQRLAVQSQSSLSCVVEDNRTGGGSGIRSWAQRMGYSAKPLRPPIWEVETELSPSGNCLITAGDDSWNAFEKRFNDVEWAAVSKWIRGGNTLIVITSDSLTLPSQVVTHFTTSDLPAGQDKDIPASIEPRKRRSITAKKPEYELMPTWWGGELSVKDDGPRLMNVPKQMQLAGREKVTVLAGKGLGQGMIYLLLDESAWVNDGFDKADNAATLARILKQNLGPQGIVAFDEYRHGYGRVESFTTLFLSLPGAKDFAWMAVVLGLFWLWNSTRRVSPPDEYREIERRTAMEYIESVASMNQRARAAPLALNSALQRLRYLLKKKSLVADPTNSILDRVARHVELAERPSSPNKEIGLVTELIQLRREMYGTRQNPRAD